MITTLSNSEELSIRKYQAVNDVLNNKKDVNLSSLSPSFINTLGQKLDTRTLILGNILHCSEAMVSSGMGAIYAESGQVGKAEAYYRDAIRKEPDNPYWVYEFAWFLIDKGINIEEGLALAEEILKQYPEHWPSIDAKGWALYKLGKPEEALKLLKSSWDLKFAYSHNGFLHIQEIEQELTKTSRGI